MPRKRLRRAVLDELEIEVKRCREAAAWRLALLYDSDDSDYSEGSAEDDMLMEGMMDEAIEHAYARIVSHRYLAPQEKYCVDVYDVFVADLQTIACENGIPQWLTDDEFVSKYRMCRVNFHRLVGLIKDHNVFSKAKFGKKQAPVAHQLMVYLHYLGTASSGANNPRLCNTFRCSNGTIELFKKQCCQAI